MFQDYRHLQLCIILCRTFLALHFLPTRFGTHPIFPEIITLRIISFLCRPLHIHILAPSKVRIELYSMLGRQHRKFYLNRFLLLGTIDVCLIVVCNSVLVKQPFQIPDFRLQATYATFIINSIHDVSLHLVTP